MLSALFFEGEAAVERFQNPVVQILNIKVVPAKAEGGADRYRIVVSDGEMFIQGMVATQSHHLVIEQQLQPHNIVRMRQYQKNTIQNKRLAILQGPSSAPGQLTPWPRTAC